MENLRKTIEQKNQMLETNKRQKKYYEFELDSNFEHGGSIVSNLWNKLRKYQYFVLEDIGLCDKIIDLHIEWMGDLSQKKVLDLGCHSGNFLSEYMAKNSKEYYAVDLSSSALIKLKEKMENSGIFNLNYISVDILSDSFKEKDFDIIYARYVLSHFKFIDIFLQRLQEITKPGGIIISFDPLNTYLPLRIIRFIIRFFQIDKEWEFPFSKKTFTVIQKYFEIINSAGSMGRTKKIFLLYYFSKKIARRKSIDWQNLDLYHTPITSSSFCKLFGVSLLLKNSKKH